MSASGPEHTILMMFSYPSLTKNDGSISSFFIFLNHNPIRC